MRGGENKSAEPERNVTNPGRTNLPFFFFFFLSFISYFIYLYIYFIIIIIYFLCFRKRAFFIFKGQHEKRDRREEEKTRSFRIFPHSYETYEFLVSSARPSPFDQRSPFLPISIQLDENLRIGGDSQRRMKQNRVDPSCRRRRRRRRRRERRRHIETHMHLSCFSLSISLDVIIKAEKPSCSFLFFPCLFLSLCIYLSISFPFPLIYLFIFFPRFFRSLSKSSLRVHHHLSAGCSILLVVMHTSAKREGVTRASQAT